MHAVPRLNGGDSMAGQRKPQVAALRVKVKSLAEEVRVIRLEERRALGRRVGAAEEVCKDKLGRAYVRRLSPGVFRGRDDETRLSLFAHRMGLRKELRATLLAAAFIRGRAYAAVERPAADNPPDLKRVREIVAKFGVPPHSVVTKTFCEAELKAWVAGTLAEHPFAVPAKAA